MKGRVSPSYHDVGFAAKAISVPSGVQPMTQAIVAPRKVRRRGSPPRAGITKSSGLPSSVEMKAIHFPSGESRG